MRVLQEIPKQTGSNTLSLATLLFKISRAFIELFLFEIKFGTGTESKIISGKSESILIPKSLAHIATITSKSFAEA